MSSVGSFSACDGIAEFYEKLNVPSRKTEGPLGGKSYTWYVTHEGQPFKVQCHSNPITLGFGRLSIESRIASEHSGVRWFQNRSIVHPETSKVKIQGPMGLFEHEIRLPTPDKA